MRKSQLQSEAHPFLRMIFGRSSTSTILSTCLYVAVSACLYLFLSLYFCLIAAEY